MYGIKVAKFGGSSLADAAQFKKVRDIVRMDGARRLVVVSAPGKRTGDDNKITDLLYLVHAHLKYGVSCEQVFGLIERRFYEIREQCGLATDLEGAFAEIRSKLNKSISIDYLVSRGEYLCGLLMADYLGYDFVDATEWVRFGYDGKLDMDESERGLAAIFERHDCVVLPGFYGALPNGDVKVMSRGGSDITGAIAAAAVGAEVYENWTDVAGILMADPRIVKEPKSISRITYSELRELSYMGANVLHEETVFPVRNKDIPVNIRDTNHPAEAGTIIKERFEDESNEERERFITGVSGRKDFSIVLIRKDHLAEHPDVIRQALGVFADFGVAIEHIPSGIDSFSLVVRTEQLRPRLYDVLSAIKERCLPDSVQVIDNIALIATVGRFMALRPGISGRLFMALGKSGVSIRMIAQGPDEINIIVGVENENFEKAIRVLYDSFGGGGQQE